jgi:hypothetical protein
MPTFASNEAAKQNTALLANRVQGNLTSGDIRFIEATYECTGTEAATGDIIDVTDVPVGAVVIPELCRVSNEASLGGSAVSITALGDGTTANRYSATGVTLNSSTAGSQAFTAAVASGVISRHKVTEATKRIKAGFARTNAVTAGKKIVFLIAYRLP